MGELVPLVCSNCGGPVDASLARPCAYCGTPAPHDPQVRARLRRQAEHTRRLAAKLRTAVLHQLHAALWRRQRRRAHVLELLQTLIATQLPIVFMVVLPYGGGAALRAAFGQGVGVGVVIGYVVLSVLLLVLISRWRREGRVNERVQADLRRCEEKLELVREARCGNCGARSSYVQVGLIQSLSCPYCRATLPTQCEAFDEHVRKSVRHALIQAHAETALEEASAIPDTDPSASLMELAGFRNLGAIFEQHDAPCWVHSQHVKPWRCVVSADTLLPGKIVLMTPDTERSLQAAALDDVTLPPTRFSVHLGGRSILGFADQEVAAHGLQATAALDALAARLDQGELVQLDGAGGTAFRLDCQGQLDAFARDFAGPLLAAVRSLSPPSTSPS